MPVPCRLMPLLPLLPLMAFAPSPSARANIAPPPRKFVRHYVRFDDVKTYARAYRFYVVGRMDRGDAKQVSVLPLPKAGEFDYDDIPKATDAHGVRLYAVPTGMPPKPDGEPREAWFTGETPAVLASPPLRQAVRTTHLRDSRDTYQTRYRIAIKDAEVVNTRRTVAETPRKTLTLALVRDGWDEPKSAETNIAPPTPPKLATASGEPVQRGPLNAALVLPLVALLGLTRRLRGGV